MNPEPLEAKVAHLESVVLLLAKAHASQNQRVDTALALLEQGALKAADRMTGLAHEISLLRDARATGAETVDILTMLQRPSDN